MIEKLLSSVKVNPAGCFVWQRARDRSGYGAVMFHGKLVGAHRVAYQLFRGAIPKGLCVLHECDTAACINPAHLFLGTRQENNLDRDRKGRQVKGGQQHLAKLGDNLVPSIRAMHAAGDTYASIAKKLGVTAVAISLVCRRLTYKHVP